MDKALREALDTIDDLLCSDVGRSLWMVIAAQRAEDREVHAWWEPYVEKQEATWPIRAAAFPKFVRSCLSTPAGAMDSVLLSKRCNDHWRLHIEEAAKLLDLRLAEKEVDSGPETSTSEVDPR